MSALKFIKDSIAITKNEFRQFRRSRSAILISLLIIPMFFTVARGAGSGGAGTTYSPTADIPMVLVDDDNTLAALRLRQALVSSQDFHHLTEASNAEMAVAALGLKQYYAVIVIPRGFQKALDNLNTGTQARLLLYTDDAEPNLTTQVMGTLSSYVQNFDPRIEVQPVVAEFQHDRGQIAGIQIIRKGASFPGFNIGLTIIIAIVQIFAVFYEIAGGFSREREDGTFARLILSPLNVGSMMLGKTIFDLTLCTARTFILLGIASLFKAHPNTDIGTILVLSILISLVTMGLAFVVSALKVGVRAVVILEFFLILTLYAFSGLIIDKELLSPAAQVISNSLPFTYAFDAMRRTVLVGRPLLSLTIDLDVIVGFIVASYALSFVLLWRFKERLAT